MSALYKLDSLIPKCHYILPSETMLHVSIVLYFTKSKRNLLNFKIIHTTIKLFILDVFYTSTLSYVNTSKKHTFYHYQDVS